VKLIDHGSAFAGRHFDPSYDKNSFIPFYLRFSCPNGTNFHALSSKEKLRYMQRCTPDALTSLTRWFNTIRGEDLERILPMYGIDPAPEVERLARLRQMATSQALDVAVNRFWVDT
jgi:hypothetical protein